MEFPNKRLLLLYHTSRISKLKTHQIELKASLLLLASLVSWAGREGGGGWIEYVLRGMCNLNKRFHYVAYFTSGDMELPRSNSSPGGVPGESWRIGEPKKKRPRQKLKYLLTKVKDDNAKYRLRWQFPKQRISKIYTLYKTLVATSIGLNYTYFPFSNIFTTFKLITVFRSSLA